VAFETSIKCLGVEQADILRRLAEYLTGLPGGQMKASLKFGINKSV